MQNRKGNGLAVVLIVLGAIMLMGIALPLIHGVFRLLFPVLLVVLGYYGIKSGRKIIGWIVMFIGVMSLIAKLYGSSDPCSVSRLWFGESQY